MMRLLAARQTALRFPAFSRAIGSLSNPKQIIASPLLYRHDDACVSAGVLRVINHPVRLVVMVIVEELK